MRDQTKDTGKYYIQPAKADEKTGFFMGDSAGKRRRFIGCHQVEWARATVGEEFVRTYLDYMEPVSVME